MLKKFVLGSMVVVAALLGNACGDDDSSFAPRDEDSSSSICEDCDDASSSSAKSSSSVRSSSSVTPKSSSSSAKSSSSSVRSSSSAPVEDLSSSSAKSSSSSAKSSSSVSSSSAKSSSSSAESSSSEYVPFDHSQTLAGAYKVGENAYKQFTDTRNGRSYYYITITSDYSGKSVTVMAENLNIGKMVPGADDQNNDNEIERYCYNNDTTKCDEFGGLYQWAEMMQLPSRCNTESCADLIQENHQGICPEGWRLFTWDDYVIVRGYKDEYSDGIKGLRSTYGFSGTNASGFSLTGAGMRTKLGAFDGLKEVMAWFRPEEYESDAANRAHHGLFDNNDFAPAKENRDLKVNGFSVRCVMVEK
ncbi:FISUMP domain-containing protein [Fibrobacter sp. UWR2]|uniref:FISUMP domain-containing protein n=1 Tax=Fibrobacter sp. UWR2 TaxID=1964352 RepID=UPI0011825669|nr:FISUMP domain-containing protein [Fibrobacter sp. UWR2]